MYSCIFAIDRNNLFGKDNGLPWHYKEDLQYFKKMTYMKKVIMGEETYKSITSRNGKPLPDRINVIATLTDFTAPGAEVTHDIFGYLEEHKDEDMFVIGGKRILEMTYKNADYLYITYIDEDDDGNVYLHLDLSNFELVNEEVSDVLHFRKYRRIK